MDKNLITDEETDNKSSQKPRHHRIAEANKAFRRRLQALLALVTVLFLLVWAEVVSVPRRLVQLHQIITNQKKPRNGSVLLLLGWFLPLPKYLYWLGYLVPFLILSDYDEYGNGEIRDYLAKRKRLTKKLRLFSIPSARQQYLKHFGQFYVYDLIPFSAKFCLIDTRLTIKETAEIFEDLGIKEAPLFDSLTKSIVGVCKTKSFVHALETCTGSFVAYDTRKLDNLTWHKLYRNTGYPVPARLYPSDNWNTTVNAIKSHPSRRAIIYEESKSGRNNGLMILGMERILQYIYYKCITYNFIHLLCMPIDSLDIGTFNDLYCVSLKSSFNEAMMAFKDSSSYTLPVTNEYGRFIYLLETSMLMNVVLKCPTRVRLSVADVISYNGIMPDSQLHRVVYETDSLQKVLKKLHDADANNVVVLDSNQIVKGIITTSDMLLFLGFSVGLFKKSFRNVRTETIKTFDTSPESFQ